MDVWADLDNLAQWASEIEGRSPPSIPDNVPGVIAAGAKSVGRIEELADAIEAGAIRGGSARDGRSDRIDEESVAFGRAIVTLRRLDELCTTPAGRRHAIVLMYAGLHLGPEARAYWWTVTEDSLVFGLEDSEAYALEILEARGTRPDLGQPLGLDWRVGMVCASPATRAGWLYASLPAWGRGLARTLGQQLLEAAVDAYRATSGAAMPNRARVFLPAARDAICLATRQADEEIDEVLRVRITRRRCDVRRSVVPTLAEAG